MQNVKNKHPKATEPEKTMVNKGTLEKLIITTGELELMSTGT